MLWEHEPPASRCFHTEYMFFISFRKHRDDKKENNLLTLIFNIVLVGKGGQHVFCKFVTDSSIYGTLFKGKVQ